MYDSRQDTLDHIRNVQMYLSIVQRNLAKRGIYHDMSKLVSPEVDAFNRETPMLKKLEYGSAGYKESLKRLGEALDHHYQHNSHHPEHFDTGVQGMSLLDLIEMLVDWKAASERHENGDIAKSIEHNKLRFDLENVDLGLILKNTAVEMGWTK